MQGPRVAWPKTATCCLMRKVITNLLDEVSSKVDYSEASNHTRQLKTGT